MSALEQVAEAASCPSDHCLNWEAGNTAGSTSVLLLVPLLSPGEAELTGAKNEFSECQGLVRTLSIPLLSLIEGMGRGRRGSIDEWMEEREEGMSGGRDEWMGG